MVTEAPRPNNPYGEKQLRHEPAAVYTRLFQGLTHRMLQERRDAGIAVSSSHSEPHLNGVANLVENLAPAYGLNEREILLGRIVGQTHDIDRSISESVGNEDEVRSAEDTDRELVKWNEEKIFRTTPEEREAISYAIINHSLTPEHFKDPATRDTVPEGLGRRIGDIIYVADGLQKLGAPLIHRRSGFVGGERRESKEGDLKDMQYQGQPIDAVQAVLLESAVRLGWKNREDVYPERFRSYIEPAFAIQRDWVSGLLADRGMDMAAWVDMLWNSRTAEGMNIFELTASKLDDPPTSPVNVWYVIHNIGRMTQERIDKAGNDPDLMASATEAVLYFSERWNQDQVEAIKNWKPNGQRAKMWQKGM